MSPLLYYALPALGGYITLSIFFLRRPRLLHTPQAPAFCSRLVAHRGGELGEELVASAGGVRLARQVPQWAAKRGRMLEAGPGLW